MILIIVKYNCKSGCREAFLKNIEEQGIDEKCRAEEGNIQYAYSFDPHDSDVMYLTELWRDDEALSNHGKMEHMKALGAIKALYVDSTEVKKYQASVL